jgi:D-3-phosphoglycerate dehydrogenase
VNEKRWKVWWMAVMPGREDIVQTLEAGGCEVFLGRSLQEIASTPYSEAEMVEGIHTMDAIMVARGGLVTRKVMEAGDRLTTVAQLGVGVDQIDVHAATDLGILVTFTPVIENTFSVAETTLGMILALAKKFKLSEHNAYRRQWRSVINMFLRGKTVGIIGLGRIGSRVAQLLKPFEVRLIASDPYVPMEKAQALDVELTTLETVLKESDFVTIHAVETDETRGLIGQAELLMMKPTAYLINTARGAIVDEKALAESLREGHISGAACDVFEPEVPVADNPLFEEVFYLKTFYTPHVAAFTPEAIQAMPTAQAAHCLKALRGEVSLDFVVNPEVIAAWRKRMKDIQEGG